VEAFNVIGYAPGSKPASIKNYRDEFEPLFPNRRKGWHKRGTREYCFAVFEKYEGLDFESFTDLIRSFRGDENTQSRILQTEQDEHTSSFAQRLITGIAAEQYFESVHGSLPEFKEYRVENTTRLGCGYDFRLRREPADEEFPAIEVKGLQDQTGSPAMTSKEYETASILRESLLSLRGEKLSRIAFAPDIPGSTIRLATVQEDRENNCSSLLASERLVPPAKCPSLSRQPHPNRDSHNDPVDAEAHKPAPAHPVHKPRHD